MNSKVEKKRAFLIDLLYAVAIMALIYVFFKQVLFAVAAPFLLSFSSQLFCKKAYQMKAIKTKNKYHTFWSICWYFYALQLF